MKTLSRFALVLFHFLVDIGSSRLEATSMAGTGSSSSSRGSSGVAKWTKAAKKLAAKGTITDKGRGDHGEFLSMANPDLKVRANINIWNRIKQKII